MAVTEVAVARLVDVGGPGGAALVGEVVVIDLLAGDDELFLFSGGADEKTLIDESIVAGGLAVVRVSACTGNLMGSDQRQAGWAL